ERGHRWSRRADQTAGVSSRAAAAGAATRAVPDQFGARGTVRRRGVVVWRRVCTDVAPGDRYDGQTAHQSNGGRVLAGRGNAGGLQALTDQGVVTVEIENAELVTVAAPLELALRV